MMVGIGTNFGVADDLGELRIGINRQPSCAMYVPFSTLNDKVVVASCFDQIGYILIQAATEGNIHHLHTAAIANIGLSSSMAHLINSVDSVAFGDTSKVAWCGSSL